MQASFVWIGPARLPFLILTPACVVLGVACVHWTEGHVHVLVCILTPTLMAIGMWIA